MVDFARIQNRIYYGYGKAAIRLGTTHTIYRSSNGINPIQSGNIITSMLIGIDYDYTYKKAKKYGTPVWQFLAENGLSLLQYDYLVSNTTTYFIIDVIPTDRLDPPLCVECNDTLTITRPTQPTGDGAVGYGGYSPATAETLLVNCPASLLEGKRGDSNSLKLPLDTRLPSYKVLLPYLGGINLRIGDFISSTTNNRLVISSVELSGLGWRLDATSVVS